MRAQTAIILTTCLIPIAAGAQTLTDQLPSSGITNTTPKAASASRRPTSTR